jgi:hypothetical protein
MDPAVESSNHDGLKARLVDGLNDVRLLLLRGRNHTRQTMGGTGSLDLCERSESEAHAVGDSRQQCFSHWWCGPSFNPRPLKCSSTDGAARWPIWCTNWVYTRRVWRSGMSSHRSRCITVRERVWEFRPAGLNHRSRPVVVVHPEDPSCGRNPGHPALLQRSRRPLMPIPKVSHIPLQLVCIRCVFVLKLVKHTLNKFLVCFGHC